MPIADRVGVTLAACVTLGQVISPLDFSLLEELCSSLARGVLLLTHPTPHRIEPGDCGFMIGDLEIAEVLA
jgi:hypothetical protein